MKKLMYLGMALLLFVACNQGPERFSTSGEEIDMLKKMVADYESGNWDAWTAAYSDTTKIYYNSRTESVNAQEAMAGHKETLALVSSYGFMDEPVFYEKIIDDKGDTWVNFWGYWQATLKANGKALETPVHLTVQVADGKIVEEHGFWDNAPLTLALQEIEAAAEAQETEEESD